MVEVRKKANGTRVFVVVFHWGGRGGGFEGGGGRLFAGCICIMATFPFIQLA